MRYYQSFPTAIPQKKAGYPRVTHPSATKYTFHLDKSAFHVSPFDLHVLGTPPAFILSQDQTLMLIIVRLPSPGNLGFKFNTVTVQTLTSKSAP